MNFKVKFDNIEKSNEFDEVLNTLPILEEFKDDYTISGEFLDFNLWGKGKGNGYFQTCSATISFESKDDSSKGFNVWFEFEGFGEFTEAIESGDVYPDKFGPMKGFTKAKKTGQVLSPVCYTDEIDSSCLRDANKVEAICPQLANDLISHFDPSDEGSLTWAGFKNWDF